MGAEETSKILQFGATEQVRRIESARYIDPAFYEREKELIFRRAWIAACRVDDVSRPGAYRTLDYFGESVVVIRDHAGQVGAFHNTCRHRGSKLLDGCGHVQSISCPYHGWQYGLDGSLKAVPRAEGFERLAESRMNLLPVRTETWAGFVWINLDEDAPPLSDTLGGLDEEMAPYRLEEMEPIDRKVFKLPVNWKTMLENVTDYYHVPVVHGRSVGVHVDQGPDLLSFGEQVGHQRIGNTHTAVLLAQILVGQGRAEEAVSPVEQARAQASTPADVHALDGTMAQLLTVLGRLEEADTLATQLVRTAPRDMSIVRLLAQIREAIGQRQQAMAILEDGLNRCCSSPGKCGNQPLDVAAVRHLVRMYLEDRVAPERTQELLSDLRKHVRQPGWEDAFISALLSRNEGQPHLREMVGRLRSNLPDQDPRLERLTTAFGGG